MRAQTHTITHAHAQTHTHERECKTPPIHTCMHLSTHTHADTREQADTKPQNPRTRESANAACASTCRQMPAWIRNYSQTAMGMHTYTYIH